MTLATELEIHHTYGRDDVSTGRKLLEKAYISFRNIISARENMCYHFTVI